LLGIILFSLQFASVQTFITKKVANYLSNELHAKIELGQIHFVPFSELTLTDLKLSDQNGNPLFSAKKIKTDLKMQDFFQHRIVIEQVTIERAYLDFKLYKDSSNFTFLVNYFSTSNSKSQKKNRTLAFSLNNIILRDNQIKIRNFTQKSVKDGVDFSDIELNHVSGQVNDISFLNSSLKAHINKFKFSEKSGFLVKELSTTAQITDKFMEFKDLDLQTNSSKLGNYLKFSYSDFSNFNNFITDVQIASTINNTYVDSKDIQYFAPQLNAITFAAQVHRGKVSGTINNLTVVNSFIETGEQTSMLGNFNILGLSNIDKTIFDFQAIKLTTSAKDLEIIIPELTKNNDFSLSEQLHKFGNITFDGLFKGFYHSFQVNGDFETKLGKIRTDSKINLLDSITYSGKIQSDEFQIAEVINSKVLEKLGFNLQYEGNGLNLNDLHLSAQGSLTKIQIGQNNLDSAYIDAVLYDKLINVFGEITDTEITLAFDSKIDIKEPEIIYDVEANVDYANLKTMGFVKKDSIIVYNSNIITHLVGNSINNLNGDLLADQISIKTSKGQFTIDDIYFSAEGNETDRLLILKSNVVDVEMTGEIDLNTLGSYFKALAMRYAPAIGLETMPYNRQTFDLNLNIKSFEPISAFLDPSLTLEDGATLEAHFSSEDYTAKFDAFSPFVKYKGFKLENLKISENADQNAFSLDIIADKLFLKDSISINHVEINNLLTKDSLIFSINGAQETDSNYLSLNGNIHFAHNKPAYIKFNKSAIILNHKPWHINTDAEMRVSKGKFYLNNLQISHENQVVDFNGIVSNENDKLEIKFSRFNLSSLESFTTPLGIKISGELNGNIEIYSIFKKPYLSANISTTPLVYNQIPIGHLKLVADFDPESKIANLNILLIDDIRRGLTLTGTYQLIGGDQNINLKGSLNNAELILFQPFIKNLASNLIGKISSEFEITGDLRNPKINGTSTIHAAEFSVNYLKTTYNINNQSVLIENNNIVLDNLIFTDIKNHQAVSKGIVNLNDLNNPYIDISVVSNNVMILNTNFKDNNLYYGTVFSTGTYKFKGYVSAIEIDIKAKSEDNTAITIPFNTAMTISDSDFIYFISKDSIENKNNASKYFLKGMTMNMDLELTPSAEVNVQTDLGSLKGTGFGEISLKITSLGDFEMFGDYSINSGKFHFTAQDFINKYFDIKQGGTIRWTGSPSGAVINISALYQQRTSIGDLYDAAGRARQDERVLAQADMIIKGTLNQPDVTFDLNFPQTPYVKDELQAYLSDANNVNQQALSLIIRRSFTASSSNEIGKEVNNTLLSAGTEIAFNQLNNILAQSLNINFLDFNIRSLNDASASFRFFDDRLILTGGVVDRRNIQTTDLTFFSDQVATDAELTYKIRRDGSLMFRAYNRLNTRNILFTPTDDYMNAVGLVYRQEFNTLGEFWKKMWTWKAKQDTTSLIQSPSLDSLRIKDTAIPLN